MVSSVALCRGRASGGTRRRNYRMPRGSRQGRTRTEWTSAIAAQTDGYVVKRRRLGQIRCSPSRYGAGTSLRLTLATVVRDWETRVVVVLRSVARFWAADVMVALVFTRARRWAAVMMVRMSRGSSCPVNWPRVSSSSSRPGPQSLWLRVSCHRTVISSTWPPRSVSCCAAFGRCLESLSDHRGQRSPETFVFVSCPAARVSSVDASAIDRRSPRSATVDGSACSWCWPPTHPHHLPS